MLHTQAEAKLASQLDESRKLLDAQREESRAQLSSLGDEMLRYRAEAEAAHEARGQAEAANPNLILTPTLTPSLTLTLALALALT